MLGRQNPALPFNADADRVIHFDYHALGNTGPGVCFLNDPFAATGTVSVNNNDGAYQFHVNQTAVGVVRKGNGWGYVAGTASGDDPGASQGGETPRSSWGRPWVFTGIISLDDLGTAPDATSIAAIGINSFNNAGNLLSSPSNATPSILVLAVLGGSPHWELLVCPGTVPAASSRQILVGVPPPTVQTQYHVAIVNEPGTSISALVCGNVGAQMTNPALMPSLTASSPFAGEGIVNNGAATPVLNQITFMMLNLDIYL